MLGSAQPYLLDFSAVWCAPCKALEPIIQEIAREYRGQLRVGKIDIDNSPGVASRLGIRGAPTVVLFRAGKEQARQLGLTNKRSLLTLVGLSAAPLQRAADAGSS